MENVGILYFSSTGNSLYIAKKVKERLGGTILYMPNYEGSGAEFEKVVVVTPIYSFGLPIPTLELLDRFDKHTELIVIQNYGGMKGGADRLLYEYALKRELNIKGVYVLKMPENFTLVMSMPAFYLKKVLKSADKRIDPVVDSIEKQTYRIPKAKRTKEKTYLKNKSNWHIIGERFSVGEQCIHCEKCVSVCPVKNISSVEGKITFGDRCIACLGCFHRCPQHAITYMNKRRKKQYLNPNVSEEEIGKDL